MNQIYHPEFSAFEDTTGVIAKLYENIESMTIDMHVCGINRTLSDKIPYSNPTLVREAVNRNMMVTTEISKIMEILNRTNARISVRSKAGVKKSLFIAASPSKPRKASNFRAKSCP